MSNRANMTNTTVHEHHLLWQREQKNDTLRFN